MQSDALDSLPKVLLHDHHDGGLRLAKLRGLLAERSLPCPAADDAALARWFHARAHAGSLEQYLHFETAGGNTTIGVTVNGGNPGGTNPVDLSIVLQGVTLVGADDASKISNLLATNKLVVDL